MNDNSRNIDTARISPICHLSEDEMIKRTKYVKNEIFNSDKVSAVEQLEDGYSYIYHQPVDFSLKLVEFINLERKCCPSFKFALEFEPRQGPVKLMIYGSEQIRDLLAEMIHQFELKPLL